MLRIGVLLAALITGGLLAACGSDAPQAPPQVVTVVVTATPAAAAANPATPAPTAAPTPTLAHKPTAAPTATPAPTSAATFTSAPTPAAGHTPMPTPTAISTPTPTPEPAPMATQTPQPKPTATPIPTPTRRPQPTPTPAPPSPITNLEHGAWLERNQPAQATQITQLPWIADGIDDAEREAAENLIRAALWYPDAFDALIEMSWLRDRITIDKNRAIYGIRGAARLNPELAEKILQKPWVQDGITRDEGIIIRRLYWLAGTTDEATQQKMVDVAINIVDMPFLDDVTFAEARAVMSLDYLTSRRYQDSFRTIMSHPKVQDGITDQEAKVIAVLRTAAHYKPEMIPHLLDGLDGTDGVYLEERTIQLPLTGETLLTFVRTKNRTTASMGYLEHAVRFAEKFIAAPLPTNYLALYFGDFTGQAFGANNWWTHMAMSQSDDGIEEYADTIAHEVGHYYFRDSWSTWINEGTADLISFVSEYERAGYPFETHMKNRTCDSSVKTLPASDPDEHDGCARNLGERFFVDLYRTLGQDAFLQGFRALYRMRLVDNPDDDCWECTALNVHHVLEAFTSNVPEDIAAKAEDVLVKWYGPLP